ncbi:P-loop NTPase family protein [Micromonospora craniellae]|uniref:Uncharacterized protein n=1 Tax=Micromonospora craniellae TaxID=2294034 RepID=A0A372G4W1_9ACTN|nr:hypothetical protein [Micromonospora craniellae]QOC90600.1 hypothetical protein ID554_20895 [Micromonospora craniellae]RFS48018.1 hypothetical protein D0Q02_00460 [Micromonospora craniellae]
MSEARGSAPAATGSVRRSRDVPMLVERAREGDPRAVARLITLVESGDETLPRVAAALAPQAVRVLEGAGCDVVLVETVGVGQAEIEAIALGALRGGTQLPALAAEVAAGAIDPYAAADTLLAQLSG